MSRDDVRAKIETLLGDLLKRPVALADATRAADVAGWDSLAHMRLLVALEDAFNIQFGVSELVAPADVGELIDLVERLS